MQAYLRRTYQVDMTTTGILRMLWRLNLRYTRPTYTLAKAAPAKQRIFRHQIDIVKKLLTDKMVLLYEDETHVRAYQSLHTTWSEAGKQREIPTHGHHASVTIFGAVHAQTGEIVHQTASSCKQESFLSFLKHVLHHYKHKYVIMVTDNARMHRSKAVQAFLNEYRDRILLMDLPLYSPQLNPIER